MVAINHIEHYWYHDWRTEFLNLFNFSQFKLKCVATGYILDGSSLIISKVPYKKFCFDDF